MMNDLEPDGFRIPIHRSVCEVILITGLPRMFAIFLWSSIGALVLGMHQLWILPIGLVLHFFFASLAKSDPYFFDVFIRAVKNPKRLEP